MELLATQLLLSAIGFIAAGLGYLYKRKLDKETEEIFKEHNLEW